MVRWRTGRRSTNVEDRRGRGAGIAGGGIGILVIAVVVWLLGGDPRPLLDVAQEAPAPSAGAPPADDETAQFVSAILASTEDTWSAAFADRGGTYRPPTLVLFTDMVRSGCGTAGAQTGPFYCPLDEKVYIDLGFFHELARMGGPGDFAAAYVIGHEVGHHVQNLSGTADEVRRLQEQNPGAANALSVRIELQADCYAGMWANHANRTGTFLEPGDIQEGLAAAAAIGDDRLARSSGRAASPETFTHGTSEQRAQWLSTGLQSGTPETCDTFRG
jgi:hypothetical protein